MVETKDLLRVKITFGMYQKYIFLPLFPKVESFSHCSSMKYSEAIHLEVWCNKLFGLIFFFALFYESLTQVILWNPKKDCKGISSHFFHIVVPPKILKNLFSKKQQHKNSTIPSSLGLWIMDITCRKCSFDAQ